jgi:hypothetical protein
LPNIHTATWVGLAKGVAVSRSSRVIDSDTLFCRRRAQSIGAERCAPGVLLKCDKRRKNCRGRISRRAKTSIYPPRMRRDRDHGLLSAFRIIFFYFLSSPCLYASLIRYGSAHPRASLFSAMGSLLQSLSDLPRVCHAPSQLFHGALLISAAAAGGLPG